jgi:hypothetical protein
MNGFVQVVVDFGTKLRAFQTLKNSSFYLNNPHPAIDCHSIPPCNDKIYKN